ncbi:hypothetical protein OVY01_12535 [Robbsia sp. Bb-Pol-6]|uniref:Uncharacterized protein n=1 Tax=Robbsia betulipollinis TaxID=2981849 RepID=A0ABT3ZND0_9BURK|nr:hypothetical protein [Robbsia betulipollinis]MCY0388048.1 hypothetical protein [Robbsia betulipollinis]
MPIPKKIQRDRPAAGTSSYLDILLDWTPGWGVQSRLDTKLARARSQDEPVLYSHLLPGLDLLLCAVPGARAPYPALSELRQRCLDSVAHALAQPPGRIEEGGHWYEFNGLAVLVFASSARARILRDFGADTLGSNARVAASTLRGIRLR